MSVNDDKQLRARVTETEPVLQGKISPVLASTGTAVPRMRHYTLQSAQGLKLMHSEKRRQELVTDYKAARKKWPHESQVLELADVLL